MPRFHLEDLSQLSLCMQWLTHNLKPFINDFTAAHAEQILEHSADML
jgi:hypothetical protein